MDDAGAGDKGLATGLSVGWLGMVGGSMGPKLMAVRDRLLLSRATGLIVVVADTYWWAVFLAMHVLEPEFSPIKTPGSAYVLGAYGSWMTTTYFAIGAALLSAGLGLATLLSASRLTRAAFSACFIAGVGAVLAGLFPMDFPGPPRTSAGRLHALGGALTFPGWVLGTLLYTLSIRRDRHWGRGSGLLLALSVGSIGMLLVMFLSILVVGFAGYAQRLLLALLFAWMIMVGIHLIRSPDKGDR